MGCCGGETPAILAVAADGGSLRRRIVRLLPSSSPRAEETPRRLAGLLVLVMLATIGAAARVSDFAQAPEDRFVFAANPRVSTSDAAWAVRPASAISATPSDSSAAPQSGGPRKEASHPTPSRGATVAGGVPGGIDGGITAGIEEGVRGGIAGGVSGGISGGVEGGVEDEEPASDGKKAELSPEDFANLKRRDPRVVAEAPGPVAVGEDGQGMRPGSAHKYAYPRRVSGVVRDLKALGYEHIPVESLVSMRIHGVSPEQRRARLPWAPETSRASTPK
jgi:hypothetical protein